MKTTLCRRGRNFFLVTVACVSLAGLPTAFGQADSGAANARERETAQGGSFGGGDSTRGYGASSAGNWGWLGLLGLLGLAGLKGVRHESYPTQQNRM